MKEEDYISLEGLLELAKQHYERGFPFVIAKEPNADVVQLLRQDNEVLHDYDATLEKEGFVLVPFTSGQRILLKGTVCYGQLPASKEQATNVASVVFKDSMQEKERHLRLVKKAIDEIRKGTFEKVVLSRKIVVNRAVDPLKSFANMLLHYPTAFCYLCYHPKVGTWLAATPEILLSSEGGAFQTMALAGTQPAPSTLVTEDNLWHTKEREEQQIVTDTIVAQLRAEVADLTVSYPTTVRAGSVVHLCTKIRGTATPDKVVFLAKKLHPTPAVCGYPTEAARQFILENEFYAREYYTGYCGWVSGKRQSLYVNLRCMQITDEQTYLYVGGGITKDSVPEKEYDETLHKAQTMRLILAN